MYGYEDAGERWLPVHSVETVVCHIFAQKRNESLKIYYPGIIQLISVISLLSQNRPDLDSPANVDAAKEVRDDFACERCPVSS